MVSEYRESLEDVAKVLKQHITAHPHKEVIFRSTLPQHLRNSKDGYYLVLNKSAKCLRKSTWNEHWTKKQMEEISRIYGFKYLNSTSVYVDRWDLNESPDCTHFCYTPEVIVLMA